MVNSKITTMRITKPSKSKRLHLKRAHPRRSPNLIYSNLKVQFKKKKFLSKRI
jgi:hypothetical protein